ncbi:M14 family zinc carboxypeptidase [Aurantibacter sp.]|uniref:M14 family zinc carboxypeptidase n=1 Tax=Aurantibacter sp. TaxID=2807103 RepID=UPI0035C84570
MENQYLKTHNTIKESSLFGRYISLNHIEDLIRSCAEFSELEFLGFSELNAPIYNLTFGNGPLKVLMWSQMHGNESTTTKAVMDLLNWLKQDNSIVKSLLESLTISVIPMLNPDGAEAYTRINANKEDLNRDAQNLTQRESNVFNAYLNRFKPNFCFNLHGQRTIFSAGATNNPATLSFLAPAYNTDREINNIRKQSMRLIASVNEVLQTIISNQVGRYDDGFNVNCLGDTLTMLDIPTILFEAGHYKDDYNREEVRRFTFVAILEMLFSIKNNVQDNFNHELYFNIPENQKLFCDVLIQNALIKDEICDIEIIFKEILINKELVFLPKVEKITKSSEKHAHYYLEANSNEVLTNNGLMIFEGYENDEIQINFENYSLNSLII